MNRFSFDLKIDPLKFHRDVRDYPYYTFATDFMHFVFQKCGLDWTPLEMDQVLGVADKVQPRSKTYSPHPLSPCTETVQKAVEKMFISNRRDFTKIYNRLVADSTDKLKSFQDKVRKVLSRLVTEGDSNYEVLFQLFYIGRLAAVFYERGTTPAADIAPLIITYALREKNEAGAPSEWFQTLYTAAIEVISWYEDDSEITVDVYLSGVDSDSESSDLEEEEEDGRDSDVGKENVDGGVSKDIPDKQETDDAIKEQKEKPRGSS